MMIKENERITYEEFMTMFKFAPRMCYTLYDKAEDEIEKITKEKNHYQHLYSEVKKQKDDAVKYLKERITYDPLCNMEVETYISPKKILRMLGEIE